MSVVIGTLTIDLKANTASFSQSMDKMSQLSAKTANDIKRSLEKITAAGVAMAAAIGTGTVAAINGALDAADKMGKLAQTAGTTAETLSVLSYAAKLSGVETEQLGLGLVKLSKAAFQAQNGNVQLERVFARLGVSVTDSNGRLKDSGLLMEELAKKLSSVSDGAGKTAIATQLFGKAGASLIPFLNQYGSKQEEINALAHRFGLELSTSTTQLAAEAREKLENLKQALTGVGFAVLGATLPAMNKLGEQLVKIAEDANIPDLGKVFGEKVSQAVTFLGNSLDFAERHAHGLKIALEGLAAIQLGKIAIPIVGDLAAGGLANVGKGLDKATLGLLGLERALPTLGKFAIWAKDTVQFVALLAAEEGIASAATYVLSGTFAAIGGPIGIAVAAIAGLGIALYKFRDSTFSLQGQTYQLRDVWSAAWIVMGRAFTWVKGEFLGFIADMRKVWSDFTTWFGASWIVTTFKKAFGEAFDWASRILGSLTPKFVIDALNQAKRQREEAAKRPAAPLLAPPRRQPPPLDTSGLGAPIRDVYGDEIRKLDQAIAAERAYLSVLDATPEKIQEVNAAEKARATILELNNRLVDSGRAKLTALQEATITQKVALEETLKSLNDYGKEIVGQQHSADLAIQQARTLAAANLEGDAAVRRATVDNAILGLTYNRTAEQIRLMTPELAKLRDLLSTKASAELIAGANKEIDGLRDELAERRLVLDATLGSIDAQRQAALASKLYSLNQNIAETADEGARNALLAKRDAIVQLTQAEWAAADAQAALSLRSPTEQYARQTDELMHAVNALTALQGGVLTYGQQLEIAAKNQENFNKATDETIALMLREGSAADGVKAFFLEMEKQGKSTAETLYDAFNQAFSKLSEGLTEIVTAPNRWKRRQAVGQFGTMFEDLGKQLLGNTFQQQLQGGLAKVGQLFGINLGSAAKKLDGSSAGNALWVRLATANGVPLNGFGLGTGPSSPSQPAGGSSSIFGPLNSIFGSLVRGQQQGPLSGETLGLPTSLFGIPNELEDLAASTPSETVTRPASSGGIFGSILGGASKLFGLFGGLIPRASGGDVSPSDAYLVGEMGPEILTGTSGRILSNSDSRRMIAGSGGDQHSWTIDARGSTDPAQTIAQFDRYMRMNGPKIAALAVHAVKDGQLRRPPTAR